MTHHQIVREQNSEQESLDQLKQKKADLIAQQKHKTDQRCVCQNIKILTVSILSHCRLHNNIL